MSILSRAGFHNSEAAYPCPRSARLHRSARVAPSVGPSGAARDSDRRAAPAAGPSHGRGRCRPGGGRDPDVSLPRTLGARAGRAGVRAGGAAARIPQIQRPVRELRRRLPQPLGLFLELLRTLHLVGRQPADLLAPPVMGEPGHAHRPPLQDQDTDLPELPTIAPGLCSYWQQSFVLHPAQEPVSGRATSRAAGQSEPKARATARGRVTEASVWPKSSLRAGRLLLPVGGGLADPAGAS